MKILHYALGFPPYRSGGLTRYVMDVMQEQQRVGHNVAMLWPGVMGHARNPRIREHHKVKGVDSFELQNPLPVVLDKTVRDPQNFHYAVNKSAYEIFLGKYKPDVIHVHTLQGLHAEFLEVANALHIPTLFSTHDFFGLYPMNEIFPLDHKLTDEECTVIDQNGPKEKEICFMQSVPVRWIKGSNAVRFLIRKGTKEVSQTVKERIDEVKPYSAFREYEVGIINQVDRLLYNSSISKQAYERYCTPKSSCILHVTHAKLPDKRKQSRGNDGKIHVAFLGGDRPYKGLSFLLDAFQQLVKKDERFHLDIFGLSVKGKDYISCYPSFSDFAQGMKDEDVLVVPSVSFESFGFVVLESLAYGMPVIVSDCVGAKDLLPGRAIFHSGNVDSFQKQILQICDSSMDDFEVDLKDFDIANHVSALLNQYVDISKKKF